MRRGRDRLDGEARAKLLERAKEESPGAFRVELEIRPFRVRRERRVRRRALGENGAAAVEDDNFEVRLADVEDRGRSPLMPQPIWNASAGGARLNGVVTRRPSRRLSTP